MSSDIIICSYGSQSWLYTIIWSTQTREWISFSEQSNVSLTYIPYVLPV